MVSSTVVDRGVTTRCEEEEEEEGPKCSLPAGES